MRGFPQRVLLSLACFIALGALVACPPHPPAPVGPSDAADASPAPVVDAARPPKYVGCTAGCANAEKVCPSVTDSACGASCNRVGAVYARCLADATGCYDVKRCDPLASSAGAPRPIGR